MPESLAAPAVSLELSPAFPVSAVPLWMLKEPRVDKGLLGKKGCSSESVAAYIENTFSGYLVIYTDASRTEDGRVGIVILNLGIRVFRRASDSVALSTAELLDLLLAVHWVEECASVGDTIVTASDSSSALASLKNMISESR